MSNELINGALVEWKYISGLTLKAVEAFPADKWDFSPGATFGSFAKQLRHVICCRGVFADGFVSHDVNFGKKHSFYSGALSTDELTAALHQSTENIRSVLAGMENQNLSDFRSNYYGDPMTFIEHFSAMTCHEALHRGQWNLYAALAKKEI